MAIMKTLTLNGEKYSVMPVIPATYINLPAAGWRGDSSPYSQVVALSGVTPYTKVDLQPTLAQIDTFYTQSLGFFAINEDCVVTVYSIGNKPTDDIVIQVTMTEVEV